MMTSGFSLGQSPMTTRPNFDNRSDCTSLRTIVRSVLLGNGDRRALDSIPMTHPHSHAILSIELEARLRNAALYLSASRNAPLNAQKPRNFVGRGASRYRFPLVGSLTYDGRSTGRCRRPSAPFQGKSKNGYRVAFSEAAASCAGAFFDRIQVRPQFRSRYSREALDLQHAQRRDFIPLRHGLLGDVQRSGEPGEPAGGRDSAIEWCF